MAAKQTPGQPSAPNAAAKALHAQFSELKEIITEIPLHVLTDRARKELGLETPAEVLDVHVKKLIHDLSTLARIGDQFAVESLRNIGLMIVNELDVLAGSPDEVSQETDLDQDWTDEDAAESYPTRFAKAVEALSRNSGPSVRTIEEELGSRTNSFLPVRSEAIAQNPMLSVVEIEKEEALSGRAIRDSPPRLVVESIVQLLVSRRLLRVARVHARELAGGSVYWPIRVAAFSDSRQKHIDAQLTRMGVGSRLPFRLAPIGKPRFLPGKPSSFALGVCLELESERLKGLRISTSHREELERQERLYLENPKSHELNGRWAPWLRKAALLPEFSSVAEVQELWIEAGLAWAEHHCGGEWDSIEWHSCIERRKFSENTSRLIPTKDVVEWALRKGIQTITKLCQ